MSVLETPRRQRPRPDFTFLVLLLLIVLASTGYWAWTEIAPGLREVSPDVNKQTVVLGLQTYPGVVIFRDDEPLLRLDFVRDHLYPNIEWDEELKTAVITTDDRVVRLATDSLTALVNDNPLTLTFPVEEYDGAIYLPISPLEEFLGITYRAIPEANRLIIDRVGDQFITLAVSSERTVMRIAPDLKGAIMLRLEAGADLVALKEQNGWFYARTRGGLLGYIRASDVEVGPPLVVEQPQRQQDQDLVARSWLPPGTKVNLVWEQVVYATPSPAQIGQLPGVNIVSPTWFHLADSDGNVENLADTRYITWAHDNGMQVWALFSNGFTLDRTHVVLNSLEKRTRAIHQVLALAALYDIDGINIDFENVDYGDQAVLVEFIRELVPLAHEQGLVVSMDVTVKSQSRNWSMVYDRARLAQSLDYMMVMTYDENGYAGSPVGSVASLPWVESGIRGLLQDVPARKLVLGLPFYTRIWTEEKQADGSVKVSSQAVGMERAQRFIREQGLEVEWDPSVGQNVARGTHGNTTYTIWLEDEQSMELRVNLVKKYGLAGIAAWRRGFETEDIWTTISDSLGSER